MQQTNSILQRKFIPFILIAVFLVTFGFFLFLQSKPVFPDPDSFYHIKMAELVSRQGVVESFPWLAFTGLTKYYTDQHFLYHVFLAPFVTGLDPVFGAKLATVFINAALLTLIAAFLIRSRVRFWWASILILLVTNPFLFRINLVKAPGLSLILLITGLWFLFSRRVWPLAVLGFVYVWTYGGFILLGIFGVIYLVVSFLKEWHAASALASVFRRSHRFRLRFHSLRKDRRVLSFLAILLGLLIGILVNPYFPKNLFFAWQQLVQIGIVNFQNVVNVGGEWHPYGFIELLANTVFVSIAVLIALVIFAATRRKQTAESWALLVLTVFFFLITLKSRRYVELYVPFATLFAAFVFRDGVVESPRALWHRFVLFFERRTTIAVLLTVYISTAALMVIIRDERQLIRDLQSGFSTTYLAGVGKWLSSHTPPGSIVVHSDWDEFPILFYHDTDNRYIVGLDPTFMYQHNKALYMRWADLTSGKRSDDATQIITHDLQSGVVVVTKDHQSFDRTMSQQTAFTVVYEDTDAKIYQLKNGQWPSVTSSSVGAE